MQANMQMATTVGKKGHVVAGHVNRQMPIEDQMDDEDADKDKDEPISSSQSSDWTGGFLKSSGVIDLNHASEEDRIFNESVTTLQNKSGVLIIVVMLNLCQTSVR